MLWGAGILALVVLAIIAIFAIARITGGPNAFQEKKEKEAGVEEDKGTQKNEPPQQEKDTDSAVIRISGTQGVSYRGNYGTTQSGSTTVEGTLGAAPTDYEVPLETERFRFDTVHASFSNDPPRQQGTLRVEILADGEVV